MPAGLDSTSAESLQEITDVAPLPASLVSTPTESLHYLSAQEALLDPLPLFVSCACSTYFHVLVALTFHGRTRDPDLFYEQERLFLVLQKLKDILIWVCLCAKPSHPIHQNRQSVQNRSLRCARLCQVQGLGYRYRPFKLIRYPTRNRLVSPQLNKFRLIGIF